jgi:hypothetical protein
MDLRDRIQRWWRPAQWKDDHPQAGEDDDPLQATERRRGKKQLGGWFSSPFWTSEQHTLEGMGPSVERDFKKPR